jgi:predicted component of type VI protein secretion system
MDESAQHKLDRLHPPRVQVTVDVEAGDVIVEKELPFKVGFVSDREGWVSARTTSHVVEPAK